MKYLKNYKLFEELDQESLSLALEFKEKYKRIKIELDDILISLKDDDIKYRISDFIDLGIAEVRITIQDKLEEYVDGGLKVTAKFFTWEKIKHEILHVISFLESEDLQFSMLEVQQFISNEFHNHVIYDKAEIEELEDSFKFTRFEITFYNEEISKSYDRS
jgi:hypothetical protein